MAFLLDEAQPLPFAPGSGPFKIKGDTYKGHLRYVSENVPGGVEAMFAGFKDPRLAPFFEQQFLAATFYDIIPLVVAGYVCARACRKSFSEFVRMRSHYQASRDLNGLYRVLLKVASPSMLIKRLPALLAQYVNFVGAIDSKIVAPGHAELRGGSMPTLLVPWFSVVNETYIEAMMTIAGAKRVTIRNHPHQPDGASHGFELVAMRYDVFWE